MTEPKKKITTRPPEVKQPSAHITKMEKPTPLTAMVHLKRAIADMEAFLKENRGSGIPLIAYQGMLRTMQRQVKIVERRKPQLDRL